MPSQDNYSLLVGAILSKISIKRERERDQFFLNISGGSLSDQHLPKWGEGVYTQFGGKYDHNSTCHKFFKGTRPLFLKTFVKGDPHAPSPRAYKSYSIVQ
jgi:hypothetical protein